MCFNLNVLATYLLPYTGEDVVAISIEVLEISSSGLGRFSPYYKM